MKFVDSSVSTQTFTVRSNIQNIDLARFYEHIKVEPAEPVSVCQKKTNSLTRRAKQILFLYKNGFTQSPTSASDEDVSFLGERTNTPNENINLPHTIIQVKYQSLKKGKEPELTTRTRKRKNNLPPTPQPVSKRNFLNCITMIVFVGKKINIKLFKNGVFQLTGCKNIQHVMSCIDIIRSELLKTQTHNQVLRDEQQNKQNTAETNDEGEGTSKAAAKTVAEDCFSFFNKEKDLVVYIKSAMRNIDFALGFKINRTVFSQKLMELFNEDNNIIVPDAVGNKMDMKIKIRLSTQEIENLPVTKITYPAKQTEVISYKQCVDIIEQHNKKLARKFKDKFISIFVFQNGKVLLSAADETVQETYFNWFIQVVQTLEKEIIPQKQERKTFLVNRKIV